MKKILFQLVYFVIAMIFLCQSAFSKDYSEQPSNEIPDKTAILIKPELTLESLQSQIPHDPNFQQAMLQFIEMTKERRNTLLARLEKAKNQPDFHAEKIVQPSLNILKSDKFYIKFRGKPLFNDQVSQANAQSMMRDYQKYGAIDTYGQIYSDIIWPRQVKNAKKVQAGVLYSHVTLIKDGENSLFATDYFENEKLYKSVAYLYHNGKSYEWTATNGKSAIDAKNKEYIIKNNTGNLTDRQLAKREFDKSYQDLKNILNVDNLDLNVNDIGANIKYEMFGHQVNISGFDEKNIADWLLQEQMYNKCMLVSKTGEQNINGDIFQYEEYESFPGTKVCRYYLKNGQLKKYICLARPDSAEYYLKQDMYGYKNSNLLIDKGSIWKEICEKETAEGIGWFSNGVLLDIKELRDEFSFSDLPIPFGIKK